MKKTISAIALLFTLSVSIQADAYTEKFIVKPGNIANGFVIERIWLQNNAVPKVALSDVAYAPASGIPADAKLSDAQQFQVAVGVDRKKPFLVVRIPAFAAGAQKGQINQVSSFTISFDEAPMPAKGTVAAARTTDASSSVLSTGKWYKIGVTKTGLYKIDKAFLSATGASNANLSDIRVFGNGGRMLSENNIVSRPSDLQENAVMINSNGEAVFYAQGPTGWDKDSINQVFRHVKNLYTDTAYYFITFDAIGSGLRVQQQSPVSTSNVTVTSFDYYDVHDSDMYNPNGLGKLWYGEQFNTVANNTQTQTFGFDLGGPASSVLCSVSFASNSNTSSRFDVSLNNVLVSSYTFSSGIAGDNIMNLAYTSSTVTNPGRQANVAVTFTGSNGSGYLDYIELNARRDLTITGDQLGFRDWKSVGPGNIAGYQLTGANSNTIVWDVTNPQVPVAMPGTLSGSTYAFAQNADRLHEFVAMNSQNLYTPKYIAEVTNQNLHGLPQVDLIMVTYPGFMEQAKQLKQYHETHDKLRVALATTTEVYNEFSSGGQDICAIRDFARMFYKRAGSDSTQMPKYLLLFGGASYDYKNRVPNNSNFIPVFESALSTDDIGSFSSDDFYGFLDDSEYIEDKTRLNALDIGVGRLPARDTADANNLVYKILHYADPATLGPWRISTTIVADKGCTGNGQYDLAGNHMDDAELMAATIQNTSKNLYNQEKVYLDAMPYISTPAGIRCPNANAAINQQVYKGTFLINYNGHGNPQVWSGERILSQDDFNNWNNANMLPFVVTATCDFGQFDHPQFVSAAEQLVLRKNGGVIAILTTTQAVYSFYNRQINSQYLGDQFARTADWRSFGEANRNGKNITFLSTPIDQQQLANFRKFALLGDPALVPDFPQYKTRMDNVIDNATGLPTDTVKALGSYTVNGSVLDNDSNLMTGFNGLMYVSFFDKPRIITTITGCNDEYRVQNNLIYKGKASVANGKFSFTFITPKDINYAFGAGKVSTYAQNEATDAAGMDTTVKIGGYSDHPVLSSQPPVVKAYINDTLFRNGGITGSNTSLYVTLFDQTGINVSGNDIGHDLTAVLDGNVEAPYILNDYYETAPNTYQRGTVSFPISGIADGRHTITVRAWDVNNNMGEGSVDFVVVDGKVVDIAQLMNYPNPFNNITHFVFEHNHPEEELNVRIDVYNTGGDLVKTLQEKFTPTGSRSNEISWDGTDNNGSRLPSGVYIYRLNISSPGGYRSSAYQKLVIVR